ncbi:hypothetical protein TNIN_173601, partial [Trichonephila inaurata madagascariensis]
NLLGLKSRKRTSCVCENLQAVFNRIRLYAVKRVLQYNAAGGFLVLILPEADVLLEL